MSLAQDPSKQTIRFTFENGVSWQQVELKQRLIQVDRPLARVVYQNSVCYLEIEGVDELIKVTREP